MTATTKVRKPRAPQSERLVLKANIVVPRALRALSSVAQLANLNPTPEQANKILVRLQTQVEALTEAFTPKTKQADAPSFTL